MSFREKVEKIVLDVNGGVYSKDVKENFLKSIHKDISAALDVNKVKYDKYLDERIEEARKDINKMVKEAFDNETNK